MPRVSVIIPVYNGDRHLAQAIESVLHQTYQDWELIVVDDGSTDRSREILQPYESQIHYHYQPNQGVAAARNQGIQLAQGELIAFLDQDDYFLPEKFAVQVAQFDHQPTVGLLNSGWRTVRSEGSYLADVEPWHQIPKLDLKTWILWKPVFLGALMVRREWLEQVEKFDPMFQQTSDVDWILRLVYRGCPTDWSQQVTVCYRQHDRNTSRNAIEQAIELEAVLEKFFAQSDRPELIRQLADASRYQSLVWAAWQLYRYGYLTEMAIWLEKSLRHTPFLRTETILDWVNRFSDYAAEVGYEFNSRELINLPEWQRSINQCLNSSK